MVEWQDVGMALTSLAGIAGVVWGWVLKQRAVLSETRARVAEDERDKEMANSAALLYSQLSERLKSVEVELREMKLYSRKLELHIKKLEDLMRSHGITPPPFEP